MARAPEPDELLSCLPHAVARLDAALRVTWLSADFVQKVGVPLQVGDCVTELFGPGRTRAELEGAAAERRPARFVAATRTLTLLRAAFEPLADGDALLVLEPGAEEEDRAAFAEALQELSRAVGETLDAEAACAAAVVALVRSAHVTRADVFLRGDDGATRHVATSALGTAPEEQKDLGEHEAVQLALASGQPQVGLSPGAAPVLFAAVPVVSQRRSLGAVVLFKPRGAGFSARELDLWSSAASQLAVAVENGRLYREVENALRIREDFMSIASHELKTPLTALRMGLHTLEKRVLQGAAVELGQVLKCHRQVSRLAALVEDLLDASRLERGRLSVDRRPFDLARLILEVVSTFRFEQGRDIALHLPPERLLVLGDRGRLEQVLQNLLENAFKYSEPGAQVVLTASASGGRAFVSVKDRGIGIPRNEHERVFEKFYRAKNSSSRHYGGLGLGLYISRAVLQLHGGELSVHSEEGKGATFTAALPLLSAKEIAMMRRRVLVVDDDPSLRAEAGEVLGAAGYDVLEARDATDALARLAQLDVDLVLASATLQVQAAEVLRDAVCGTRVPNPIQLLISGAALPEWATPTARLCGRPYDRNQLVAVVRSLVT